MCIRILCSKINTEKADSERTDEKDENALIMETVREESDNLTAYLAKLREVIRAEEHIPLQITSFDIHVALLNLAAFIEKQAEGGECFARLPAHLRPDDGR